jgi:hypothetical protein
MFSIADLQTEDDVEGSEGEEGGEEAGDDAPYHAFPVRASLSITKVRSIIVAGSGGCSCGDAVDVCPRVPQRRHGMPRRALHR